MINEALKIWVQI